MQPLPQSHGITLAHSPYTTPTSTLMRLCGCVSRIISTQKGKNHSNSQKHTHTCMCMRVLLLRVHVSLPPLGSNHWTSHDVSTAVVYVLGARTRHFDRLETPENLILCYADTDLVSSLAKISLKHQTLHHPRTQTQDRYRPRRRTLHL